MATIEQLQAALEGAEGVTPQEVLDAFLPEKKEINNCPLHPLTLGHSLFLSHCDHPLASGRIEGWKPHETAIALFAFTRDSEELKREVEEGTLEDSLTKFTKEISLADTPRVTALLMAHYLKSIQTGVEMRNPSDKIAQKKTPLGGFSRWLRGFVGNITGGLITSSTSSQ